MSGKELEKLPSEEQQEAAFFSSFYLKSTYDNRKKLIHLGIRPF